jgi:hypothetical protein
MEVEPRSHFHEIHDATPVIPKTGRPQLSLLIVDIIVIPMQRSPA